MPETDGPVELFRDFVGALELDDDGDGRTIYGCAVPYDTPTLVADRDAGIPYMETWKRGAFRAVVRDPSRVMLTFGHAADVLSNQIGGAVKLTETERGLETVFRALPGPDGDKALELIRAGLVRGLSVHAVIPRTGTRTKPDGTVERTLVAKLPHVALVAEAAYAGAAVTAVRDAGPAPRPGLTEIRAEQDRLRLRFSAEA